MSDNDPALHHLLNTLHQEGSQHSRGVFTLDQESSREKLRRYRLSSPWLFLGKLVQTAVCRRGRWARFTCDNWRLSAFECECPPFTGEQMALICQEPLGPGEDDGAYCLALALEGALGLGSKSLEWIEVYTGSSEGGGWMLRLGSQDARIRLEPKEWSEPWPGLRVILRYTALAALPCAFLEGWHANARFSYAPIPVYRLSQLENRHPRMQGARPGEAEHFRFNLKPARQPEVYVVAASGHPQGIPGPAVRDNGDEMVRWFAGDWLESRPVENPGDLPEVARVSWLDLQGQPAVGCLAWFWRTPYLSDLEWVHHGVVIKSESVKGKIPEGWSGVALADGLALDLAGCNPVENDDYLRRLEWLGSHLQGV